MPHGNDYWVALLGLAIENSPRTRPEGYNSLVIPWGRHNFVNPPFHPHDGVNGQGPTAFVRKAIAEQRLGKISVLTLPVQSYGFAPVQPQRHQLVAANPRQALAIKRLSVTGIITATERPPK